MMNRWMRYVGVLCLLLMTVMVVTAQDEDNIYTFESGVQFIIPEGATIDDSSGIPVLTLGEQTVMDVVDPLVIGETPDATVGVPLGDVMDFLLRAVGFEGERTAETTSNFVLSDGREIIGFDFTNASGAIQSVFVLRLSDGRVGALNFRTLDEVTQDTVNTIVAVAESLDIPTETTPSAETETTTTAEDELTAGLTQEHTYESGVTFRFPEDYTIVNTENPPATIGIPEVILVTMVDPNIVGMPANEPMDDIIDFAIGSSSLEVSDFEDFDVGGREAAIGSAPDGDLVKTMVLVRFADGTVGIMDITTQSELTEDQVDTMRSVAASFNSESSETATTRDEIGEANQLFDQAIAQRDANNYEEAVDLFTQAIELNPGFDAAYYGRALTYGYLGEIEDAVADYEQVMEIEPEATLRVRTDIVNLYALYDDMESAITELESLLEDVDEEDLSENILEAFDVYQAIADGEYNSDFYFSRANRLRQYGQYDLALEANQVMLDNEPDDPTVYAQRGVILNEAGEYDAAVEALTTGIELEPLPILFYNRGYTYSLMTDDFDAIVDKVHDYQCIILLADDTITQEQLDFVQQGIDRTIISSDDYEPITDPADCEA